MANPSFESTNDHQHFDHVESTHIYLSELVSKTSPPHGFHVTADYQSGGRGQIGRSWHGAPGLNLLVSYVFYPENMVASRAFDLSVWVSVVLEQLVSSFGIQEVRIKWPNDIYICDQKVGGILIQNTLRGELVKNSIVSVGLNVNEINFPTEIPNPTSLRIETGQPIQVRDVLSLLTRLLDHQYHLFSSPSGLAELWKSYKEKLWGTDRYLSYQLLDDSIIQARVLDVEADGKLRLLLESGEEREFVFREVKWMG